MRKAGTALPLRVATGTGSVISNRNGTRRNGFRYRAFQLKRRWKRGRKRRYLATFCSMAITQKRRDSGARLMGEIKTRSPAQNGSARVSQPSGKLYFFPRGWVVCSSPVKNYGLIMKRQQRCQTIFQLRPFSPFAKWKNSRVVKRAIATRRGIRRSNSERIVGRGEINLFSRRFYRGGSDVTAIDELFRVGTNFLLRSHCSWINQSNTFLDSPRSKYTLARRKKFPSFLLARFTFTSLTTS